MAPPRTGGAVSAWARAHGPAGLILACACACLLGQVYAAPPRAATASACDAPIVVDGLLRCAPVVACDGAAVRAGDAFTASGECAARTGRMSGADLEALAIPVDLATASQEELDSLPGIGPELARRIAAARPLRSIDELLRVDGIGPVRLAAMRSRVRVDPP
jgi:hypothetical protein